MNIELLSPAKDYASGIRAINCGADALYIGAEGFGARKNAANSVEHIAALCRYAHLFGVRVYVTMNTLVFEDELSSAKRLAMRLKDAGVDALIIQDMAFVKMDLGMELHASTQMTNTNSEWVGFLKDVGFSRVVLERGLTFEQMKQIALSVQGVEYEVFVHGALCVGFSGACYLSRSTTDRSGNRGDCAQSCRLSYDLVSESGKELFTRKHLLSLQDLDLSGRLEELIGFGACSFKVEGRLKDDGYVATTTAHYNNLLNDIVSKNPNLKRSSTGRSISGFTPRLGSIFSRGGSEYYFSGAVKGLACFDTPKAVGERIGTVKSVGRDYFEIDGTCPAQGDGVVFITSEGLQGTNINRVDGGRIYPNRIDDISVGMELRRNYDHVYISSVNRAESRRVVDARAKVSLSDSQLELNVTDSDGNTFTSSVSENFPAAQNADRALRAINDGVAKSRGSIFNITSVDIEGDFIPFVPASKINALRREALAGLTELRDKKPECRAMVERVECRYDGLAHNVVNSLAEEFYLSHGARIDKPLERCDLRGEVVMTTPYCIRREIGECLCTGSKIRENLFLHRGAERFALDFDCKSCLMKIIKL